MVFCSLKSNSYFSEIAYYKGLEKKVPWQTFRQDIDCMDQKGKNYINSDVYYSPILHNKKLRKLLTVSFPMSLFTWYKKSNAILKFF